MMHENDDQYRRRAVVKGCRVHGVKQKTRLVNMGLKVLVKQAASKRLAALGGTAPEFTVQERDSKYGVASDLRGDS